LHVAVEVAVKKGGMEVDVEEMDVIERLMRKAFTCSLRPSQMTHTSEFEKLNSPLCHS
jgi:hypothetical protein